jgi:hypothetical protein
VCCLFALTNAARERVSGALRGQHLDAGTHGVGSGKETRRAAWLSVGVSEDGLHITDDKAHEQIVPWPQVTEVGVSGGRLSVTWLDGSFAVGAREMEDGMDMIRAILQESGQGGDSQDGFRPPTNFIPLDPK